ncbi:SOS response-associated peptidase [Polycladidibacter stylochi]|uniref:SOS response-associated peptidase n=1 Tax=Polycladidibacter stylochi TaxID=1807766 RepID=UPI000833EE13|nr:SOS response-associated peptidase [Pseudovibrio stylochi]
MCGSYSLAVPAEEVHNYFQYINNIDFPPRYNILPQQPVLFVMQDFGRRQAMLAHWGFLPAWVNNPLEFSLAINARAETVVEKPAFKNAMKHRRCLIPASGFYERARKRKGCNERQAYHISAHKASPDYGENGILAMAGLWETYSHPDGGDIDTLAIITVPANDDIRFIHHRSPAIIEQDHFDEWLNTCDITAKQAAKLLKPSPEGRFYPEPVSNRYLDKNNDGAELIAAVRDQEEDQQFKRSKTKRKNKDDRARQLNLFE